MNASNLRFVFRSLAIVAVTSSLSAGQCWGANQWTYTVIATVGNDNTPIAMNDAGQVAYPERVDLADGTRRESILVSDGVTTTTVFEGIFPSGVSGLNTSSMSLNNLDEWRSLVACTHAIRRTSFEL